MPAPKECGMFMLVVLHIINIDVSTLVINGHYDEAQDVCVEPFAKKNQGRPVREVHGSQVIFVTLKRGNGICRSWEISHRHDESMF